MVNPPSAPLRLKCFRRPLVSFTVQDSLSSWEPSLYHVIIKEYHDYIPHILWEGRSLISLELTLFAQQSLVMKVRQIYLSLV